MAHFAPVKKEGSAAGPLNFANVWDVFVNRGVVYVNDVQAGTSGRPRMMPRPFSEAHEA